MWGLSLVVSRGQSLLAVPGFLTVVTSFLAEHRLKSSCSWASEVAAVGSIVVALRLNWSEACGIFLNQGSKLCSLHWQEDSYPLYHQESPIIFFLDQTHTLHISEIESYRLWSCISSYRTDWSPSFHMSLVTFLYCRSYSWRIYKISSVACKNSSGSQ